MRCQEKRTHSEFLTRKRCVAPRLLLSSRRSTSRAPDKLHDRLDRTRPPFTDRFIGDSLLQNQRAFGIELWRFFLISWPSDRAQVTAHERGTREREKPLRDTKNPWRHQLSLSRLTFATAGPRRPFRMQGLRCKWKEEPPLSLCIGGKGIWRRCEVLATGQ